MTSSDHPYTYGIEEEFFLASAVSRNAVTHVPKAFVRECRAHMGESVQHEMLQSQVEIATPVLTSAAAARESLDALRQGVGRIAAGHELRLVAAGTHPLGAWREQVHTDKPRYDSLMDDFQIIGRRNLLCALHVHVAVPPGVDRVALMNRIMPWLPVLLALSTSSPFWNRQRTGLVGYRQAAYDEWPRTGIPDFFANEAEYGAFVDLLAKCGAMRDGSFLWWAIRPSSRYPTLELRIADSCTHLDDALAIAAAFRCLVAAYVRRPELGAVRTTLTRRVIDENRWRAKRYGVEASLIDEAAAVAVPFEAMLERLVAILAPEAASFDCEREIAHLTHIVRRGSSAHEQLAVYRARRDAGDSRLLALQHVVDWLIAATLAR
ncbi:carboxylate-amine ligase [Tahibacter soli]|uniref:Putative glutamate--cysteine ligase 2 n=1 Tax=Tahibacter soli TaxID=2983605 RepID=A0A9X3YPT5_9GAMM|nr:carboxylate-amine ligase [Tahibacter soli]MDC8014663.1 carboxylate-amine ligase [Tahibacter soli]